MANKEVIHTKAAGLINCCNQAFAEDLTLRETRPRLAEVNKLFSRRVSMDVVVAVIKHGDPPLCRTLTVV